MGNSFNTVTQQEPDTIAPARILVVDDEPINCDILSRKLQRAGHETTTAGDGRQAIEEIAASDFDLILLDIMMPQMDGLQALKALRLDYTPEQLPIIMVTAIADSADVAQAIDMGANDYVTKPIDFSVLHARIARHLDLKRSSDGNLAETTELRGIVEDQSSCLKQEKQQRRRAEQDLQHAKFCLDHASDSIFAYRQDRSISYANNAAARLCSCEPDQLLDTSFETLYPGIDTVGWDALWQSAKAEGSTTFREPLTAQDGSFRSTETTLDYIGIDGAEYLCAYVRDVTERDSAEAELQQARRLEAIGQLAAGIAHEINTPLQFVDHNTAFLQTAFSDLSLLVDNVAELLESAKSGEVQPEVIASLESAYEAADVEYLRSEIPKAVEQSLDGIQRVTGIVQAMKEFSHPGGEQKQAMELGQIVRSAVTVSTNEWKYIADVDMQLDESLPDVMCHPQELSQVVVNLLVNAAHAIDAGADTDREEKGRITIRTLRNEEFAELHISDTGCGIPEEVRARVFEPFFTTKEVGKGTGQGLAIAYSTIVDKHDGELSVDSTVGEGTTFVVRLPIGDSEGVPLS